MCLNRNRSNGQQNYHSPKSCGQIEALFLRLATVTASFHQKYLFLPPSSKFSQPIRNHHSCIIHNATFVPAEVFSGFISSRRLSKPDASQRTRDLTHPVSPASFDSHPIRLIWHPLTFSFFLFWLRQRKADGISR
jgi:hypothetical protein